MEEELRNNFEELARRERALSENEAKFRSLFTTMVEGNALCEILTDDQGKPVDYRILEVNPAFEKDLWDFPGIPLSARRAVKCSA